MRNLLLLLVLCALIGGGWYYFRSKGDDAGHDQAQASGGASGGGSGGQKGGAKSSTTPVGIATAKTGTISVYLTGLGNITPRSTVTVHTLINGQLMNILFKEGQMVKKDGTLAKIDDRPYVAQLEEAQGLLVRDQALLSEAQIDLERYKTLWAQDSIAKQQLDLQTSLVKQYEGAVKNDQGQIDTAKVNITYSNITSPVTGRVGLRQVDAGNIVHTTDTNGIVIVTELQPITSIFTIPEDDIPGVFKHVDAGETLTAEAWDRDNKNKLATGTLTAVDNQVDSTTGTVKFRAEFANEDNALFPSQFVNIRLKLQTLENVVTIPNAGIQRGTKGTFIYLVKPDKTVAVQNITLGPADGETVSVTAGVNAGDQMVVDGADNLRDGSKIDVASIDGKSTNPSGGKGGKKSDAADDKSAGAAADKPADDKSGDKKADGSDASHHKHKKHSDDADKTQ